jgi:septum site-determining protein MinD
MGKAIAVHSYKGGTGKTMVSVNLAATLARKGKSVCLFDFDFRAPSLQIVFKSNPKHWLNDFFDGKSALDDVLVDVTQSLSTQGAFQVGLANPSSTATRQILTKDQKWEIKALQRLLAARAQILEKDRIDYLIMDTSPGIAYSSLNAIVASDLVVLVSTLDESDIDGTQRMIQDTYTSLEKKSVILLNKVLIELLSTETKKENLFKEIGTEYGVPLLELIPCYCDVLGASRTSILTLDKPDHPFTKLMERISERIATELESPTE